MIDHQERLRDLTESYLKTLVSEASGDLPPNFDSTAPFAELGVNSFQVLKIIKVLEADFGTLPKSLLFEKFNVEDLASYFVEKHHHALSTKFARDLQGSGATPKPVSPVPAPTPVPAPVPVRPLATNVSPPRVEAPVRRAEPIRILEKDAFEHPELKDLVQSLFNRHASEGCVSRGTRKIAPNLFIGSERRGYFNYSRSKNVILVYGYAGPQDYLPVLVEEMVQYCRDRGFQLNILGGDEAPNTGSTRFSATPFGVMQRVPGLKDFRLDGGPMRRLRYQVSKFEKAGKCRTEEYRCGTNRETDEEIARVIDRWCESRTVVNPLVHDVRAEILAGTLGTTHRLFLTYLDDVLQNVILITAMSEEGNGYLMDLEFYPAGMPLGGLEFAIVQIIETLVREGCDVLSLGGTYGVKLEACANADPEVDRILDELRSQSIFNDEGNLQFKNKFRPVNSAIFLSRPVGCGNAETVLDIIMMIADPLKMQTPDTGECRGDETPSTPDHGFNPLNVPDEQVAFDLKTDSWAQLSMPAIAAQMKQLHARLQQPAASDDSIRAIFPFAHSVLTASGRAAENLFFKAWPKKGLVLQNLLFPTTIFHEIDKGFTNAELPVAAIFDPDANEPFKGNLDLESLRAHLTDDVSFVCIEVANNAAGGSPVSLQHLRDVKALLSARSIPLVIDGTRIVENAQLLIERETECAGKAVWAVVREILSCADAVIGSLSKDFCVKHGGIIATNDAALVQRLQELLPEEGGGIDLIDRRLNALALQDRKQIETRVLRRMESVRRIWQALRDRNVPVAHPAGGHCILVDVKRIPEFSDLAEPVASFVAWLFSATGIRAGAHSVGMQKNTPINDLVRLAIPIGLKREEIDVLIEKLTRAFDRKVDIPELAKVSGGVHATYRLVRYHNPAPVAEPQPPELAPEPLVPESRSQGVHEVRAHLPRSREIAIVGMAGRYPKAKSSAELWQNLAQGRDCIEDIPADRLEKRRRHGRAESYRGGFIDDIDKFDSLFFNISPREAELLDPQERLFLEVAWEAIEDAGYYPEILAAEDSSRNIGVFVGAVWAMYQMLGVEEKRLGNQVSPPNSFLWSIANRVSYWMNLSGPSMTIDTACSSSLTALYLACEAIAAGDCSSAIVGGVNLDVHQAKLDINLNGGALSSDGVCRSFGKGANGYVAGEGVGALYLKSFDRAVRDGDHIHGVIKSAVVNHGGRTAGYIVPNPTAQTNVIAAALEKANVDARSIGYVEAHGTGTELGDPIEITGLNNAFERYSVENQTCAIGSVKSNIGHLEAAAGVAGVAKVLLQMKHRRLVPSLHSSEPNEFIDFAHSPFYVPQEVQEWKPRTIDGRVQPLRAGISSFGAGGANAHVILESYERPADTPAPGTELLFPLSARNEDQLREMAARLASFLRTSNDDLRDVAHTLQVGRKSFEYRLAIVANGKEELLEKLDAFVQGKKAERLVTGHVTSADALTRLLNRREKEEFGRLLSQRRDPNKLAELWVEGLLTDWSGLQGSGRRVSLPTYPFAGKRHWAGGGTPAQRAFQPVASIHPLLDSNESTFERQLFKKTFNDRDFFIHDHHVADIPTLPGVAYLELARKAGEIAANRPVRRIKNILWVSPISVENSTPRDAFIELKPSGDSVQFEVFSEAQDGRKILHSQGKLGYAAPPEHESIDLDAIRSRCSKVIDGDTAYPLFKSLGLNLGTSFRVLQDVYKSADEVLGVLQLPEIRQGDLENMVLLPSLIDGSLQTGMAAQLGERIDEMLVPFSIGEVEILHPLQRNCFSYVTEVKEDRKGRKEDARVVKTNVLIVDETGKVLVRIRECTGVPLRDVHKKEQQPDAEGFTRLHYGFAWEKAPIAAAPAQHARVLLFAADETMRAEIPDAILVRPGAGFRELDDDSYELDPRNREDFARLFESLAAKNIAVENIGFAWPVARYEFQDSLRNGIFAFLYLCQAIIARKLDGKVQLLYIHSAKDEAQPQHEAVSGFLNTLRIEHPKLLCKTVAVDGEGAAALRDELGAHVQDGTAVRYEAGDRYVRRLKPAQLAESDRGVPLKDRGVYVITGGAGGLGLIFAEYLAKEHKARLVLSGRSALSPEREVRLEELRRAGAEVVYVAADVSSRSDVENLLEETRSRFGQIHGIIHSAGVLRDSYVRNKTYEEMSAVFAPKVFGTLHLDELTKDDALDFFVTFSSLAAVTGNAGQADYGYANAFMDAFVAAREMLRESGARSGKSLSINWSLWADGGMRPDEQTEVYFRKTLGMRPLSTATGVDAFARGLASGASQFVVLEGIADKLENAWGMKKKDTAPAAPAPAVHAAPAGGGGSDDLRAKLQDDLSNIVMEFLKLDPSDMSVEKILLDLGFDSIGLTTFANAVNDKYQLDITPILFFEYPSVAEIAKHLAVERESEIRRHYQGTATAPQSVAPTEVARAEGRHDAAVEFRKGWNPSALDRDMTPAIPGAELSPELRFVQTPIAIVGMSGAMPQSEDLDEFWENLESSTDMVTVIPRDRWNWEDYYGDPLKEVNKSNSKWGGFMKEVDKFDPLFFGISPREAEMMDPQQRLFLQHVWKAVEDSGHRVSDLAGTRTGVFVGVATNDYSELMNRKGIVLDGYSASGNSHSITANRISFLLGLRGPSAPIDTACSSSLVALHRAIESIHTGSCDMAIVGGVQVMLSPSAYISFGMAGMLSGDGKCKSFDKNANGYVRGEGCGAILIKTLAAAEADGDHIYAVIRATAENHGGRVTTLTAPNPSAQTEVLVDAYTKAHIDPTTVGYIECHGTGTSLGDPIEIQALAKTFSELYARNDRAPAAAPHCALSSVKTNIGHLETAAGIAGVLKALLAIKHKQIPANIHFEELNPYINLKGTPFYIADKLTPWEAPIAADGKAAPRRAGVSSFGFGGANAHVVLEEYVAPANADRAADEPQLIVLSAKNEDRLKAYIASMHAFLGKHEVALADLAYTLQVGRDEMQERLALVASSVEDLRSKLESILNGATTDGYRHNIRQKTGQPAEESAVAALIERKELSKIAELWAHGAKIDWRRLHGNDVPKRIAAPTYPFARDRYWMPEGAGVATATMTQDTARLHPLVHRNVSTLREQKFASRFTGAEFFLSDHRVRTEAVLPGVAYISMAAAAGELAAEQKVRFIRNLTWMAPITVSDEPRDVEIALTPAKSEVEFAVRSSQDGGQPMTHARGKLAYQAAVAAPDPLNVSAIQERCKGEAISGADLYPFLCTSELNLGKGFQVVQKVHAGEFESLAVLQLPEHLRNDADQFGLHPALLDGAVHSAIGMVKRGNPEIPWRVPYSVAEVQIFGSLKNVHYAYAVWDAAAVRDEKTLAKLQLTLLDRGGNVLVHMKDFAAKPFRHIEGASPAPKAEEEESGAALQSLIPVWNPVRIESRGDVAPANASILVLGGDAEQLSWVRASYPEAQLASLDDVEGVFNDRTFDQLFWIAPDLTQAPTEDLIEQQERGVLALFRIIKALLHSAYANKSLQWTIITGMTQRVRARDGIRPAHASVAGLVGSLAKENPRWDLRLLDLESLESVSARECLSVPVDKQGNGLAHRQGEWFRQALTLLQTPPETSPVYRASGVYVVIGGAGGVGEVWSRFMIERHQANLVWIGRREFNDEIAKKIDALTTLGPAPLYISADATDADSLERARRKIHETYPVIHGVVHSAIVLKDQSLARMDESAFRAGLSAKVDVGVNMDRVFGNDKLDFMLFFSSIVSMWRSPGQSNYAAGCAFKDSFAHQLQQDRPYRVRIMNWGYWGSVGIVSDQSHNDLMRLMGVGSIEPDEGMASLDTLLGSDIRQMVLVKTLHAGESHAPAETVTYLPKSAAAALQQVQDIPPRSLDGLRAEMPTPEMNDLATEILASSLRSLGLFHDGIHRIADLSLEKRPAPFFERWLACSGRYLQREAWLADDWSAARDIRELSGLWNEWDAKRAIWATSPSLQARMALLEGCLRGIPAILSGRQRATDVMFPNSSMHLVDAVYRDNKLAEHFNEVLGRTLAACIEQQLRNDRERGVRILEIGAGTGGTTATLLPALKAYDVAEYCYSDISKAFSMHAEKNFQPQFPTLTTAIFDVTKPLAAQSIGTGQYEFAIAANVLHATPDIRETVRNAKAVLKTNGILLLNEISTWSLFNHLTFGLLEGWWMHEDTALRLPGSPGLAPETWREILAEEGFEPIVFPAADAHEFGQQIIAAASDGRVRQRVVEQKQAAPRRPVAAAVAVAKPKETQRAPVVDRPTPQRTEQMSKDYVREVITAKLSEALHMDPSAIRDDAPFADYGVDSIIGVNFVRTICEELQIELETTSLFEYSTVGQLTGYIVENFHPQIAGKLPIQVERESGPQGEPAAGEASFESRFEVQESAVEVVESASPTGTEPIAIIGMSGRFAQSETLEAFWQNLAEGNNLVSRVTRWNPSDCVISESAGKPYCSHGSFIDSADRFDAAFFGISAEEATYMDPQQRLFLEESWRALEDAGYAGKGVHEKQCGVYVGCGTSNYTDLFKGEPPAQAWWGNSQSVVPARIAYHLNLQGPAIAVDTACSSALVAIHLACQGLWSRETEMALAGGVYVQATAGFHKVANNAGMLSPDGKCYTFDARANGFVPAEAVGVVVMKRLRDALRDGDHIRGVIAGSGINQDGASNGLIAPNAKAQERLERSVYDRFAIHPESIQLVEAHGTGTIMGDSIEFLAISRAFREYTDRKQFCAIGTVKTNIGHAGNAAGIAGVLKLLLALEHRQLPPSLHFEKGNPAIDIGASPFFVNTELRDWSAGDGQKRRAAVSTFGFSGTNAHLVIEEAPSVMPSRVDRPGYLIVLSARTAGQLKQQVLNLIGATKRTPDLSMNDMSFSLLTGRAHLPHRLACVARDQQELIRLLEQWLATGSAGQVFAAEVPEGRVREQAALKRFGNYCIQECRTGTDASGHLENLAAIADLYVQGYALDFAALFAPGSRRMPLPAYPFARERYWIDAAPAANEPAGLTAAVIHPLLHTNTSNLSQQSYSTVFTGTEPFLRDHDVLPDLACIEMARAAVEDAAPRDRDSFALEFRDIVFAHPVTVTGHKQVEIALFPSGAEEIEYEIHSIEAGQDVVHCQGRAVVTHEPAPEALRIEESALTRLTHASEPGYGLSPRLMIDLVQAGLTLIADPATESGRAPRAAAVDSMRVLAPCAEDAFAWVRSSQTGAVDIDVVDAQGNVCVQIRGLSFRLESRSVTPAAWQFCREAADDARVTPMPAEEKIELFLRQETALQLQKPVAEIPTNVSYFDLGLGSLAITNVLQKTNALLGESLSPSALFEYRDIESLAGYLATVYRSNIDAIHAVRQDGAQPVAGETHPTLTSLRKTKSVAARAEKRNDDAGDDVLEQVLLQETSIDDGYEQVTF